MPEAEGAGSAAADAEAVPSEQSRLTKMFGAGFPGRSKDGRRWRVWLEDQIKRQRSETRDRQMHYARLRQMIMAGNQWVSLRDGRSWEPVNGGENDILAQLDIMGPGSDFRLNILQEQNPGFRAHPLGQGIAGREIAEAQQNTATYYYYKLKGKQVMLDAAHNARTDGVAFVHVYIDREAGPVREDVRLLPPDDPRYAMMQALGYEVQPDGLLVLPMTEAGVPDEPGAVVQQFAEGDVAHRVVRATEVWFDPEAKTVNGPYDRARWGFIRRVRDLETARLETGVATLKADATAQLEDPVHDQSNVGLGINMTGWKHNLPPFPHTRKRNEVGVFEYLVWIAPVRGVFDDGFWLRIVGDKVVESGEELPGGKIPLARIADGSSDDQLFKRPVALNWISDQLSINALLTTMLETARAMGSGRVMAQRGTVLSETYTSIVGSLLEYTGQKPEFATGTSVSGDTWRLLDFLVRRLEDKIGWNDLTRGQIGSTNAGFKDVSGRSLLAAQEAAQKTFLPMITATAEGMSEWAELVVDYARWLYEDTPGRMIPIVGRGDLAKRITSTDLGERSVVYMDPETLSPLPRSLRNQMLFELLSQGMISQEEFRKRSPYADIRNVHMGDTLQWERAQMCNEFLEERWEEMVGVAPEQRFVPGTGIVVQWQDDPRVHMQALEELVLDERKPFELRQLGIERWIVYEQLARAKPITDPNTGALLQPPSAAVPPFVIGVPADFMQFPPLAPIGSVVTPEGRTDVGGEPTPAAPIGQQPSGPPGLSPTVPPATSQQQAQPLGTLGAAEQTIFEQ